MTTRSDLCRLAVGAVVLTACVAGCALGPSPDCGSGDWEAVGFADGASGSGSGPTDAYRACTGFDEAAWTDGYLSGLPNYCSDVRIYRQARSGLSFPAVCKPLEAQLATAHAHGRRYWELDLEMWRLRRRARDDMFAGQRIAKSARYNALSRERLLYSRWPP